MDLSENELLYEAQRVDIEYAVVRSLVREFLNKGKFDAAEYIKTAAEYLQKATFALQRARKFLNLSYEQQLMDFMKDDLD